METRWIDGIDKLLILLYFFLLRLSTAIIKLSFISIFLNFESHKSIARLINDRSSNIALEIEDRGGIIKL